MQEVDRDCESDDREPEPCYIPELSNAIERFLDAPHGSQLIIRFFAGILSQREADEYCLVYTPTPQRYDDVCATIPELVDPEAPQFQTRQSVRQVLPGIFYRGLYSNVVDEYTDQTDLVSGEVLWDKGEGYTTVTRGVKWLVECALIRLPDGVPYYAGARTALQQLLTPQPKYNSSKDYQEGDHFITMKAIQPSLRLFTMWPRCDEASIASLVGIVMDIALNVAAVWDRNPCWYPSYATYLGGFVQARARFKNIVEATPSLHGSQAEVLPYHTRAALRKIKFRDIWDDLWAEASALTMDKPIADHMYQGVVDQFARATIQSKSQTVDMKALLRRMWRDGRLQFRTWIDMPEAVPSLSADGIRKGEFGGIPRTLAQRQTIGTDSYDSDEIHAFWCAKLNGPVAASTGTSSAENANNLQTDGEDTGDDSEDGYNLDTKTLRNLYGKAYLEAYGPAIEPLKHGKWDLDIPQDQLCVVCLEAHGLLGAKMSACGHYFHFACIKEWMNDTSPNFNLCPECRAQICNERRKVRMTGWMADSEDDEDEEDDFADDEDEESDYDDGDEDDSMLEQLEGDALRDWRAEQQRRN
ncbi:hypothetical protein J4E83_003069 [Alternaria metachromatica]|uniref:uncharacterized protein n=1 Tax=Alternaria metachromatica TaxID=283354 RepID=UPI0020C2F388|nr:uncharacterized protein J4E83_003069 [Alternaria metachromatica]KAI4628519.1 hypothetical protein J4E83_003069 [Alternaria metachromatica]